MTAAKPFVSFFLMQAAVWLAISSGAALSAQPSVITSKPAGPVPDLPPADNPGNNPAPTPADAEIERPLVAKFDLNGDHRLDAAERKSARAYLAQQKPVGVAVVPANEALPPTGIVPAQAGEKIPAGSVQLYADKALYDPATLRTVFLEFTDSDWEQELTEFAGTDIQLPAQLTLDGKVYREVGVHFRASAAPAGYKHSLNLNLDYTEAGQNVGGVRRLQLLDTFADPTFLRAVLYSHIAREYLPAPKANYVRVVINGENWGGYVSTQPVDENFVQENFHTTNGSWWNVGAAGSLAYLGAQPDAYRNAYHLESPENPAAWSRLAELCRVINQTPPEQLEAALAPLLDMESTLRFLALENVLANNTGYWSRSPSYALYLDGSGKFHFIPGDGEFSFRLPQVRSFEERTDEPKPKPSRKGKKPDPNAPLGPDRGSEVEKKFADRKNFPRQSNTDLAMLLSYSFVNKADQNDDQKLTKEEWSDFSRSWFIVMDEDQTGFLTRDQFVAKARILVTPPSLLDGKTQQTFGKQDPARQIGEDLFTLLDENHDGKLVREEVMDVFAQWFTAWSKPKSSVLVQKDLERGLVSVLSETNFSADQAYIAQEKIARAQTDDESDRRRHGRGMNFSVPALFGFGRGDAGRSNPRGIAFYDEQIDPMAGFGDPTKPLLTKLLAVPAIRNRYLVTVLNLTQRWLDWAQLGPVAKQYNAYIAPEVKRDTRKPDTYEHFVQLLDQVTEGGDTESSLKAFAGQRRTHLLNDDGIMRLHD